jgi:hypothetical protein
MITATKTEFAYLVATDGPHYLYLDTVGSMNVFSWTRYADKAIRFARKVDAEAVMDGLRKIEPNLFAFPTQQAVYAVEHGWG